MQKEIYFNPSLQSSPEDIRWLSRGNNGFLWVVQAGEAELEAARDMIFEKLIRNPKLMNSEPAQHAIVHFSGRERLHFIRRFVPVEKVVLAGVQPESVGVHMKLPKNKIVPHANVFYLLLDAPHLMPGLPAADKTEIAVALRTLQQL